MRSFYFLLFFCCCSLAVRALSDSVPIPVSRQYFHDKIILEQKILDRYDGKQDNFIRVGTNEEVNLQVSDAVFRRMNDYRYWVESNPRIEKSNEKVRFLSYLEGILRQFRLAWRKHELSAIEFPQLLNQFDEAMKRQLDGENLLPFIDQQHYVTARILTDIFTDNIGYRQAYNLVYLKYCSRHPDKIMQSIRPYMNEPFADSLVLVACRFDPEQIYTYAQAVNSPEARLINRNESPTVKAVVQLAQTPNALLYFPFLDDLLSGKQKIDDIRKLVGDGEKGYDSIGYFKLLVKTEIDYARRLNQVPADTPIAMFGSNGLRAMLSVKALQHFITPINNLHEVSNLNVRMRAIEPLTAQEIYYMIVLGENDIYTSSYKHSFNRMLQKLGPGGRGDSLLLSVNADYFKKFIKMAANFNKLDTFLRSMPAASSDWWMKSFVANLDKTPNLEDATDVADAYSSITDKRLQQAVLGYVVEDELNSQLENNQRGTIIYGLLKNIFLSADSSNKVDLTSILGIPSIYEVDNKELQDDSGRIIQQVFFYGDEDGKVHFPAFVRSFSPKEWQVTQNKEWVEIRSIKGKVWIFANRPLDNDANLDDSAQVHLNHYLEENDLQPSVVVHRGHSYWLPGTIRRMPYNAKIVVLGSCGGFKNLSTIIDVSPEAHIISTKEIGAGEINRPILNYLNQNMLAGKKIVWKDMWLTLTRLFAKESSKSIRESWDDYVPPYKNLGAIFIKGYNKKMESY